MRIRRGTKIAVRHACQALPEHMYVHTKTADINAGPAEANAPLVERISVGHSPMPPDKLQKLSGLETLNR